jgi:hypothetical protein
MCNFVKLRINRYSINGVEKREFKGSKSKKGRNLPFSSHFAHIKPLETLKTHKNQFLSGFLVDYLGALTVTKAGRRIRSAME